MRSALLLACSVLLALTPGCHTRRKVVVVEPAPPRLVTLEVEVYDPATNYVWQNVGVRIREAWLEWSGAVTVNPDPIVYDYTDSYGIAYFSSADLADARVGFEEDEYLRAVLYPEPGADEAFVQVELTAPGFPTVLLDVPITWNQPDVFVSIPFSP